MKPVETRLAGRPPYTESQIESGGHASDGDGPLAATWCVGLVAEDDIFRAHALAFVRPDCRRPGRSRTGHFPGESQTLEWSIYPIPGGDYWDFVNAVRRNWGANFTDPRPARVSSTGRVAAHRAMITTVIAFAAGASGWSPPWVPCSTRASPVPANQKQV